jgi:hypothetical protein
VEYWGNEPHAVRRVIKDKQQLETLKAALLGSRMTDRSVISERDEMGDPYIGTLYVPSFENPATTLGIKMGIDGTRRVSSSMCVYASPGLEAALQALVGKPVSAEGLKPPTAPGGPK